MNAYAKADDLVLFGRRPRGDAQPVKRRRSTPRDGRKVYLRVLCPGGRGHTAPLVASDDGHLVVRAHDIPTIGGGRVPCGTAGQTVHEAPVRTDHGHPVQCLCEGRAR